MKIVRVAILFGTCIPHLIAFQERTLDHVVMPVFGGQTLYRGHGAVYKELTAHWLNGGAITNIDLETDRVTCAGCGVAEGDGVWFYTTEGGRLPVMPLSNSSVGYTARSVVGDTFQVSSVGGMVDFVDTGAGLMKAGKRVMNAPAGHLYISSITNVPSGVDCGQEALQANVTYAGGAPLHVEAKTGNRFAWGSYSRLWVKCVAAPDAALGSANPLITLRVAGYPDRTLELPLNITDLPAIPQASPAATSVTPLPKLATWMNAWKAGARRWCDPSNAKDRYTFSQAAESQVWYYDGAWIYHRLADATGEEQWRNCASNIAAQYREYVGDGARLARWRLFPHGLLDENRRTGDARYWDAVRAMENAVSYAVRDDSVREMSYSLQTLVAISKTSGAEHPKLKLVADLVFGIADQLFVGADPVAHQVFMDGLLLHALIDYWEYSKDPRAPVAIRTAIDWIWDNAWDDSRKTMLYNPYELGQRCANGCQKWDNTWFPLVMPAFGWYWWYSGEDTYRERGDSMFAAAARNVAIVADPQSDRFTVPDHQLIDGVSDVTFVNPLPDTGRLPTGVYQTGKYFVCNSTKDTFQLSMKESCAPIVDIKDAGSATTGMLLLDRNLFINDKAKTYNQNFRWAWRYVQWRQMRE